MTKPKLTPWFPHTVKPARRGVYICSVNRARFYRLWDGKRWHYGSYDLAEAAARRQPWPESHVQHLRWRGLAEQPK